jgi:hypothetical protein
MNFRPFGAASSDRTFVAGCPFHASSKSPVAGKLRPRSTSTVFFSFAAQRHRRLGAVLAELLAVDGERDEVTCQLSSARRRRAPRRSADLERFAGTCSDGASTVTLASPAATEQGSDDHHDTFLSPCHL